MKYSVLIIDVIDSRAIESQQRQELQKRIFKIISTLNKVYESCLVKKMDFSAGDELQALFTDSVSAYSYYRLFEIFVYPIGIRGGIGVGKWDTVLNELGTQAQDGEVYHLAREAINEVKLFKTQNIRIKFPYINEDATNVVLNSYLPLFKYLNIQRCEILQLMEVLYPFNFNHILKTGYLRELIDNHKIEQDEINISNSDNIIYEELILRKNTDETISVIDGTSRQNINKMIRKSNLYEIRLLSLYAINYLMKMEEG